MTLPALHTVELIDTPGGENEAFLGPKTTCSLITSATSTLGTKPQPLSAVGTVRHQEALIIEDILYVLLGLEGLYVRYTEKYDPRDSSMRLEGPDFRIAKYLDPGLKDLTKKIAKYGKLFVSLSVFVEEYSQNSLGQVNQALTAYIRTLLLDHMRLVVELEREFRRNSTFSLRQLSQRLKSTTAARLEHAGRITRRIITLSAARAQAYSNPLDDMLDVIRKDLQETGTVDLLSDMKPVPACTGGRTLRVVQEYLAEMLGDPVAQEWLVGMLSAASRPFFVMLEAWLTRGDLTDRHGEFLVHEHTASGKHSSVYSQFVDQYWAQRFSVRKDAAWSIFRDRELQRKVLLTGKYLNVIRECSGVRIPEAEPGNVGESRGLSADLAGSLSNHQTIYLYIESRYLRANRMLLALLQHFYRFPAVLALLKQVYLQSPGDVVTKLLKRTSAVLRSTAADAGAAADLQSALEDCAAPRGALPAAVARIWDSRRVVLEKKGVYEYMLEIMRVQMIDADAALAAKDGLELRDMIADNLQKNRAEPQRESRGAVGKTGPIVAQQVNIELTLTFPVSLVISQTMVLQFQFLFRHLLSLRFVASALNDSWEQQAKSTIWKHRSGSQRVRQWKNEARALRNRMQLLVEILVGFFTADVIETSWQRLVAQYRNCEDVEGLGQLVQSFLDDCLKGCMLTNEKMVKVLDKLLTTVHLYTGFLGSLKKTLVLVDPVLFAVHGYKFGLGEDDFSAEVTARRLAKMESLLGEYGRSFDHHVKVLVESLDFYAEVESSLFVNLSERIDLALAGVTRDEEM